MTPENFHLNDLRITRDTIWGLAEGDDKWEDVAMIMTEILNDEAYRRHPRLPFIYAHNYEFFQEIKDEFNLESNLP